MIKEFFTKYNNRFLDFDHAYGSQCVDLIKAYFKEVLNKEPLKGNAIDYWRDIPGFERIKNTPINYPKQGDLIVLNIGQFGHISIVNSANLFTYNCFEQNNPLLTPCHFATHSYKNVLGWLRPNSEGTVSIARIGVNLPLGSDLQAQVFQYTSNKLKLVFVDYSIALNYPGMMVQEDSYNFLTNHPEIKETFTQMYYSSQTAPFLASYSFPNLKKYISTLPNNPPARSIAFELAHCLQYYCNDVLHAGIQIEDSNFPDDAFIQRKFNTVMPYLNQIK